LDNSHIQSAVSFPVLGSGPRFRDVNKAGSFKAKSLKAKAKSLKAKAKARSLKAKARD